MFNFLFERKYNFIDAMAYVVMALCISIGNYIGGFLVAALSVIVSVAGESVLRRGKK